MHSIRKPRVFLSHSKKDISFIRRLEADLRAAQCEPWIDDAELRAGQPWLDQIFSSGIPSCEVVLCYFTPNSAESAVFMQELDARLIERLNNARVSLLLYTSSSELRSRMRLDLQRLQSPELNDNNYSSVFPRLVSEIWRSYAESLIQDSISSEKIKRLEAELRVKELEGDASNSIFTASEQAEFKAIWARIDRKMSLKVSVKQRPLPNPSADGVGAPGTDQSYSMVQNPQTFNFQLDIGALYRMTVFTQKYQPSSQIMYDSIKDNIVLQLNLDSTGAQPSFEMPLDIESDLLRFGLAERFYTPSPGSGNHIARMMHRPFKLMFTSKFDRFVFWVEQSFETNNSVTEIISPAA